jgi:hypothetical protein
MMQAERLAHRKKRWLFPIRQQNPRPLDPLAGSVRDCASDRNFSTSASSSDNSIARRHAAIPSNPSSHPSPHIWEPETTDESSPYDNFLGIGRLVSGMSLSMTHGA